MWGYRRGPLRFWAIHWPHRTLLLTTEMVLLIRNIDGEAIDHVWRRGSGNRCYRGAYGSRTQPIIWGASNRCLAVSDALAWQKWPKAQLTRGRPLRDPSAQGLARPGTQCVNYVGRVAPLRGAGRSAHALLRKARSPPTFATARRRSVQAGRRCGAAPRAGARCGRLRLRAPACRRELGGWRPVQAQAMAWLADALRPPR